MARIWSLCRLAPALLLLAAGACAPREERVTAPGLDLQVAFEDQERPDILSRSGFALRDRDSAASSGLWGVVPGLRRAERALVQNAETGSSVVVSLYSGSTGARDVAIRLSPEASDALGLMEAPAPVRIVALRREPILRQ
jgi:hypothetical protein